MKHPAVGESSDGKNMMSENISSKDKTMLDCDCSSCHEGTAIEKNKIKEIERLRNAWIDVREQVWKLYHIIINSSWNEAPSKERPDLFKIKRNVHDLSARDPHQLFQRLEAGVREFVLEMKLRLIELLQMQAKNPSLAQNFIQSKFVSYMHLFPIAQNLQIFSNSIVPAIQL